MIHLSFFFYGMIAEIISTPFSQFFLPIVALYFISESLFANDPINNNVKLMQFEKQEGQLVIPTFQLKGHVVRRCDVDFEYFDTSFFFQEDQKHIIKNVPIDVDGSEFKPKTVFCPISPRYCEKINLYYLKNVAFQPPYNLITSKGDLFYMFNKNAPYVKFPTVWAGNVTPSVGYKYMLHAPSYWGGKLGHFILDVVIGLIFLPKWVWSLNPVFFTHFNPQLVDFMFSVIGHPNVTVVNGRGDRFYYAENFFLLNGNEHWNMFGLHTGYELKKKYRKYMNLTDIKPTKYHYINKKRNEGRHFINLNEVMEIASRETNIEWTEIKISYNDRYEYAQAYAESKILVIPCGSIAFNAISMADGTGMVTLNSNRADMPQASFCQCIRIWNILIIHEKLNHPNQGYTNPNIVIKNINRMIYTVEHQRFPPNDLFDVASLDGAKRIFWEYGENNVIGYDNILIDKYNKYKEKMHSQNSN